MDRDWPQHVFRPGEEAIMVSCFFMSKEEQGGWIDLPRPRAQLMVAHPGPSWGASQATAHSMTFILQILKILMQMLY